MRRRQTTPTRETSGRDRPRWLRPELMAATLGILCYVNTLSNDFCYDGNPIVRLSPKVNEPGRWLAIWTTDYWSEAKEATPNRDLLYRPVSLSSYRLVRSVAGPGPLPQLLVNVLLHAVVCALVARMCRHLGGKELAALIAGVIAAVLPIHAEVIDNVVGRAGLLAALGVFAAALAHRRSMNATTSADVVIWRIVAAVAAFIAMGSKESGIAVVALVILLDGYWYRPWRAASRDRQWWNIRSALRFAYLLVPLAIYVALRWYALDGHLHQRPALTKTVNILVDAPLWQRLLGVVQLWGMYWAKTLWPRVLCVDYSVNAVRLATSVLEAHVIVGLLAAFGLFVGSVVAWQRGVRSVAFLSAAILISYVPTANALMLIQVFFAERIWYLPSLWIAILAGLAAAPFVRRPVWCLAGAAAVLVMAERCWMRNAEWQNEAVLFRAAYRDHPDAVGVLRLYGQTLVEEGNLAEGIKHLNRALEIDLGFTDVHRILGQAYLRSGDLDDALRHLQIANMQVPHHRATEEALAFASGQLAARRGSELRRLREQADRNPEEIEAQLALIRLLRELGRTDEALARLRIADERFRESVALQTEYAVTLVFVNELDAAIDRYWRCVELDPADPHLSVELAMLLFERREGADLDQAWQLAAHAAELAPGAPFVLACRAELLAQRGELTAAVGLYEEAIRALPPDSPQRRIYQERARALGR